MLRKASVLLGVLVSACATTQQTPILITATPPAESPTPHVIVVTSTEDPFKPTATPEPTPMPTATPRPRWQPIAIADVEAAFREEGYRRNPITAESGRRGFSWVKESGYERAFTWEDGLIVLQVLHDKSPTVRAEHMERKFWVLDTVLPSGFMAQLRSEHEGYNNSIGAAVSGEPEETIAYGGKWQNVEAEYNVSETAIGGYRVRISLWWWQSTCPSYALYCYYSDFPGLEFTGDSSFVFHTIKLFPIEGGELFEVEEQTASAVEEPTPDNVGIGWEFNSRRNSEGWENWNDVPPLLVTNGYLEIDYTGTWPSLGSPFIKVDAAQYPLIEISMKLTSVDKTYYWEAAEGRIYFITNKDMEFNEEKVIGFDVLPGDEFRIYTMDMSLVNNWKGTIKRIEFVPVLGSAQIEIDYIRLLSKNGGDTSTGGVPD